MSSRDERRLQLAERLRIAVEALLDEDESYASISIERLMAEAGLSRSTFYAYFTDKGDLLRAWSVRASETTRVASGRWWALGTDLTREALEDALRHVMREYRPHARVMASVYDAAVYDDDLREEVAAMMREHVGSLEAHIRRGQEGGWVAPDLLPHETAAWLIWMAERVEHQVVAHSDDAALERLVVGFADVVWNTLYALAPAAR
ncbi:TetR/AcrR family transcriptional regulator [Patulibacter defluvii]|uniref:TetR/AcrR family transcriptional regulator n=1 Tax=Patulibacter defluvii TaxID=3095358 RepID=UPI002A763053|nr:TetR/AcrR family transcriptional regulator [Patulibacter sp. DM4]